MPRAGGGSYRAIVLRSQSGAGPADPAETPVPTPRLSLEYPPRQPYPRPEYPTDSNFLCRIYDLGSVS